MTTTYLPQNFTNTENLLAFFVVDALGFLVDPNEIGFRIFNEAGTQTFPAGPGKFHEVTTGGGRLSRGRFFAYETKPARGWRVPSTATEGEWRIEWRWRIKSSDAYSTFSALFDVVAKFDSTTGTGFRGISYRTYISPARIREEGLTVADLTDTRMERLILDVQAYIERETRNVFRPVFDSIRLDGNSTGKLFFGLPIIGIDQLFLNDNPGEVSRTGLSIAFGRIDRADVYTPKPDYRRRPSISFRAETDIFSGSGYAGRSQFRSGRHNQKATGVWGFVESDGTVPRLIQDAALRLVYATAQMLDPDGALVVAGPLKSRVVDRHSESWEPSASGNLKRALARSKEVEEALMFYKAPIAMASPNKSVSRRGLIFRG